jgi:uncharacterized membrane protein YfcA
MAGASVLEKTETAARILTRSGAGRWDSVSPWEWAAVAGAGLVAGAVNTIVGSGSLITFPTLLAVGLPPLLANVTNTVGLVPGSVSGAVGYRRELRGQLRRVVKLSLAGVAGGIVGAVLLLAMPSTTFEMVIPFLILAAVGLTVVQPRLAARVAAKRRAGHREEGPALLGAVFATGVYGGYFGAAQGVIFLALMGAFLADDLQRLNAVKNVVAALVNTAAAVLFIASTSVRWSVALVEAAGAVAGGQLGATVGRRLSPRVLRAAIVVVGLAVSIKLFVDAFG